MMDLDDLPVAVAGLFRALRSHKIEVEPISEGSETWEVRSGVRIGYFNSNVARRKAVLGYQMVGLLQSHGSVAGEDLKQTVKEFREKYDCTPDEIWPEIQLKSGRRRGFLFIIDPSLALRVMLAESGVEGADEVELEREGEVYIEGRRKEYLALRYERSAVARLRCLETHGYSCACCEIRMKAAYGGLSKELIHVHHILPLGVVNQESEVNPKTDLVPVCPNCHAVIHSRNPAFTVSEVRQMLGLSNP